MNKFDQIIYDRFIQSHPLNGYIAGMNTQERAAAYNVLEYFYKGAQPVGKFMQAASEVSRVKMMQRGTKGNLWRAVQATSDLIESVGRKSDLAGPGRGVSEEDYKAAMQNIYTGERFEKALEQSQDAQGKADLLLCTPDGEGHMLLPSQDEINFRNWLMKRAATNVNIKRILDCFGQFLAHANALRREKFIPSVANVTDIKLGSDLAKVVPSEFMALGADEQELEALFYYGLANSSLLQYDCKEPENVAKGNMVFLLDISESMLDPISRGSEYSKLNVACGFLLAMLKVLEQQKRTCKVFTYNTMCLELFDTANMDPSKAFQTVLNINANGGTRIAHAIKKAFDTSPEDVVIVTDGIDDSFSYQKSAKGSRRVSCLLISQFAPEATPLKNFVDSFILANGVDDFKHLTEEFM
jgi:hypothetical protein